MLKNPKLLLWLASERIIKLKFIQKVISIYVLTNVHDSDAVQKIRSGLAFT